MLLAEAKGLMENNDPAHDFSHILRVLSIAEAIGKKENADMEILIPAVILHDITKQDKSTPEKRRLSADKSASMASRILQKYSYPEHKIEKIVHSIAIHSFSKGMKPETIEAKILQDADRLDAIGAIGIARCFAVGGELRRKFYDIDDPRAENREADDGQYSIDHFYKKLLLLKEKMHTETAKEIAEKRHRFMQAFLRELNDEINARL